MQCSRSDLTKEHLVDKKELLGEVLRGEALELGKAAGVVATDEGFLDQGVDQPVLLLVRNKAWSCSPHPEQTSCGDQSQSRSAPVQVGADLHLALLLGQPDVGVHGQEHTGPASPVVAMHEATSKSSAVTPVIVAIAILLLPRGGPGCRDLGPKVQEGSGGGRAVAGPLSVLEVVHLEGTVVESERRNILTTCLCSVPLLKSILL